jgi:hypothetical protein
MTRRVPLAPAEGWLSLICVLVICLTMALAIDDARWVLGRAAYLDGLIFAAVGGALVGFLGPKIGWGRWVTYLVGSAVAALVLPLLTGLVAHPNGASIGALYQATADSVYRAYVDLAILDLSSTSQYLHYIFSVGLLVWATSMFASYAVFGHHRPLNGIVVVGVILVGNMAMTLNDQLPFLIVFSLAALLLLILSHAFDQQSEWVRRRIGEPTSISSVYLRGGSAFIAVAVAASFLLTKTAASAPLAGAWNGVEDSLIGISRSLQRFFPTGGSNRAISLTFGPNAQVGQLWTTDGSVAATISRDPLDDGVYYWRAVTYDRIDLKGWSQSASTTTPVPAGGSVLDQRADNVAPDGRHAFTFTVTPAEFRGETMLSPQTPIEVDEAVRVTTVGQDGYFATMDRDGGSGAYTVTALTQVDGNDPGQLNLAALRATSTAYPQEISDLYLGVTEGSLGPNAQALEAKIVAEAPSKKPIDLANQLVAELHSANFKYATDIRDLDCADLSTVECFATYRRGFCQQYAATMAVILRDLGVPTRIAQGFLPGARAPRGATEQILFSNAHAWVEVYFTGYGWVTFDPTGGNLSQVAPLPSGRPVASLAPGPSATIPGASRKPDIDGRDQTGGPAAGSARGGGSLGPLLGVGALLLLIVGGLAFVTWQRGPRGATSADGAYGSVTRIASRFGFGPRPGQTVYEFAGALGEVLPSVRPELETVARAKVESVYARQILGDERLASLRAAQRRLRVGLLRLAFTRKERRRR